ncbi:hypothetical protein CRG98_020558 [Punica granatum]|uniref:Uncharacterized protein n=1 Tax=Punica granatum TaxID=22663 RepID=A0A2I0JT31_PUNGR|nr:hypothetical protein CRG98_020558 [Punica granatum]
MHEAYATRFESVHLPGDAREKESSLTVYDPSNNVDYRIYDRKMETLKVDEKGRANETRTRTGCPFSSIDRGVSVSLTPRMSANHEMMVMPFER